MKHLHDHWDIKEPGVLIKGDMAYEYTLLRVEGYPFVEKAEALSILLNGYPALVSACRAAMRVIGEEGRPIWAQLRDALAAAGETA